MLPRFVAELEPEAGLILAVELVEELRLVEADGQWLHCYAVHDARGAPWYHRIGRDEATDARVIIARVIVQLGLYETHRHVTQRSLEARAQALKDSWLFLELNQRLQFCPNLLPV